MIYQFEDVKTGAEVDVWMAMDDAVDIGDVITHEGRKVKRLPPQLTSPVIEGDHFTNFQVAKGTEQASGADYYDEKGRPMWKSARRARNWAAKKTGDGVISMELD